MTYFIHTEADLDVAIASLIEADDRFNQAFSLAGRPPLRKRADGFAGLASIVVSQQLSTASAKASGVRIGAHPGLPDIQGFGRREMRMTRDEVRNTIIYQVGALAGFLKAEGVELHHIKPHGSLYFMAMQQEAVAHGVCDAAEVFGVPLFGMTGTLHEKIYQERGIPFVAEFYADLDYDASGKLILTRVHDAKDPKRPMHVGLGTDVGAGTSFSILATMNEAYKVAELNTYPMNSIKSFYLATLGGARALQLGDSIGSLEVGKEADFVVLDPNATPLMAYRSGRAESTEELMFVLSIMADDRAVKTTYVAGHQAYEREDR